MLRNTPRKQLYNFFFAAISLMLICLNSHSEIINENKPTNLISGLNEQNKDAVSIKDLTACGDTTCTIKLEGLDRDKEYEFQFTEYEKIYDPGDFVLEFVIPSDGHELEIPLFDMRGYDFVVDWADGSTPAQITEWNSSELKHVYEHAGTYQVKITGTLPRIYFYQLDENNTLTRIIQWGNVGFTSFYGAFFGCSNLTSLPDGPITGANSVEDFTICFHSCSLSSIPEDLFAECPNASIFYGTFYQNQLTEIPENLFVNSKKADVFNFCFAYNPITDIPEGLFANCNDVTSFESCFYENMLQYIPENLFANCPDVTSFYFCFGYNPLINIPVKLFDNCNDVENFNFCFYRCSTLTGTAPELWLRNPQPSGVGCFCDCTGMVNYGDFPDEWVSPGIDVYSSPKANKRDLAGYEKENEVLVLDKNGFIRIFLTKKRENYFLMKAPDKGDHKVEKGKKPFNIDAIKETVSGDWSTYENDKITELLPGNHTLLVREKKSGNHLNELQFSIELKKQPQIPVNNGDISICEGAEIPELSVSVGENETVNWYDSKTDGNLLSENTLRYKPTNEGIFYAEAKNTNSLCVSKERTGVVFSVNEIPVAEFLYNKADTTIYSGDELVLTANEADAYYWSTGEKNREITVSPIENTDYLLQIEKNGCLSDEKKYQVEVLPGVTIENISVSNATYCGAKNGEIVIENIEGGIEGGYLVSIDGNDPVVFNDFHKFPGLCAGNHSIIAYDGNGKPSQVVSAIIEEPDTFVFSIQETQPVKCHGDNDGAIVISDIVNGHDSCFYYRLNAEHNWKQLPDEYEISNLFASHYNLQLKDCHDNLSEIKEVSIHEPDKITFDIELVNGESRKNNFDGEIAISNVLGGNGNIKFCLNDTIWYENYSFIDKLPVGEYSIIACDESGCSSEPYFFTIIEDEYISGVYDQILEFNKNEEETPVLLSISVNPNPLIDDNAKLNVKLSELAPFEVSLYDYTSKQSEHKFAFDPKDNMGWEIINENGVYILSKQLNDLNLKSKIYLLLVESGKERKAFKMKKP